MNTSTAATRCFVGLSGTANADCTDDPLVQADTIGMGYDTADSAWFITRVDGLGNQTRVATGASKSTSDVYEIRIWCNPSASAVFVQVYDFTNGVPLIDTSYSTNLPDATSFLMAMANAGTAASAVAQKFQLYGMMLESFY